MKNNPILVISWINYFYSFFNNGTKNLSQTIHLIEMFQIHLKNGFKFNWHSKKKSQITGNVPKTIKKSGLLKKTFFKKKSVNVICF